MEIGIALAAVVALMTNLASLLKHRGCQHAQAVHIGRPLASLRGLASSPWFAAGWGLAAVAWLAHIAALSLAPISLVQAVLAGGAVTLAVLSQRLFADPVERRQWLALALGGGGLALLAATLPHFRGAHSGFSLSAIVSFEGGLVLLAAGVALGHRAQRLAARRGVLLAVLAGILFALAGIATQGPHRRRRRLAADRFLTGADHRLRRPRAVHGGRRPPKRRRDRDDRPDGDRRQRDPDPRRHPRLRRPPLPEPTRHHSADHRPGDGLHVGVVAAVLDRRSILGASMRHLAGERGIGPALDARASTGAAPDGTSDQIKRRRLRQAEARTRGYLSEMRKRAGAL